MNCINRIRQFFCGNSTKLPIAVQSKTIPPYRAAICGDKFCVQHYWEHNETWHVVIFCTDSEYALRTAERWNKEAEESEFDWKEIPQDILAELEKRKTP